MVCCRCLLACVLFLPFVAFGQQGQPAATDLYGDPLPAGALARLGSIRWRHDCIVGFAAFLPNGKSVITAGDDRTVRVWEFPSGKQIRRMVPEPANGKRAGISFDVGYPGLVAMSSDGNTVATCFHSDEIHLYDVPTGKELPGLQESKGEGPNKVIGLISLAFSPDGEHLATLELTRAIRIWKWKEAKQVRSFGGPRLNAPVIGAMGEVGLVWAPDGKSIATVHADVDANKTSSTVELWDAAKGTQIWSLGSAANVFGPSLIFFPDGKNLAFSTVEGSIRLVDVVAGQKLRNFTGDRFSPAAVVISRDRTKLYARSYGEAFVQECDVATGKAIRKIGGGQDPKNLAGFERYGGGGETMSLSPDGTTLLLTGYGHLPRFIDLPTGKEIVRAPGHTNPLVAVAFSPDGNCLLTQAKSGPIKMWDAATARQLETATIAKTSYNSAVSHDGQVVAKWTAGARGGIAFLDAVTGKILRNSPEKATGIVGSLRFTPDAKTLALRQRQKDIIDLYDVSSAKLLYSIPIVADFGPRMIAPETILFSADSKLMASYSDPTTVGIWDTATGKEIGSMGLNTRNAIQSGAFSSDGRSLALDMNNGSVTIYEIATGQPRRTYGKKAEPDNVSAELDKLRAAQEALVAQLTPWDGASGSRLALSPDGKAMVYGGEDGIVRFWDISSGEELAAFKGHSASVNAVAFAANGKWVASASSDTTALIWDATKVKRPPVLAKPLDREQLDAWWKVLAEEDAAKAFAAICEFTTAPNEAVAMLKEQLQPALAFDSKRIRELIDLLDHDQYKVRQKATSDLHKFGEQIVPTIDEFLAKGPPSLESRNRLEALRTKMTGRVLRGDRLRDFRAVEVLERIGTPAARELLKALADGAPGTLLTDCARAALKRSGG